MRCVVGINAYWLRRLSRKKRTKNSSLIICTSVQIKIIIFWIYWVKSNILLWLTSPVSLKNVPAGTFWMMYVAYIIFQLDISGLYCPGLPSPTLSHFPQSSRQTRDVLLPGHVKPLQLFIGQSGISCVFYICWITDHTLAKALLLLCTL